MISGTIWYVFLRFKGENLTAAEQNTFVRSFARFKLMLVIIKLCNFMRSVKNLLPRGMAESQRWQWMLR